MKKRKGKGRFQRKTHKQFEIREAIKLELDSLHKKPRMVNTTSTKSGIISRTMLPLEYRESVKEEWVTSNKQTFISERKKIRSKPFHCKDNTETKMERSNEVQGDKRERIEDSAYRAEVDLKYPRTL